jgi:hypothetical protein
VDTPVTDETTYVSGLPASVPTLNESSLIVIRTNGNRNRIGNMYCATPEVFGHTVSAFQIAASADSPATAAYVFRFLQTPAVQRSITAAASGTTGLGNIAVSWLRKLEVPWPAENDRSVVVETADAIDDVESLRAPNAMRHRLCVPLFSTICCPGGTRFPRRTTNFSTWRRSCRSARCWPL